MTTPFIDLKTQYQALKPQIQARIDAVLEHGQYIMGPEVKELEDKLAVFTAPSWLSEQIPASFADFKKAGQPAAPAAPSLLPIPGPAPTLPSPLQPSK